MITAIFENNQLVSYSLKTWQYDYGQILRIEGLNLPTAIEIHFALTEKGGEAVTRIGMTKDGVTDVVIPDSFLENNDITQDYRIYAFIYLRDDTSGQTEYKIPISVTSRPKPEAFNRPEDGEIFKEAIQAVRESADQAAESARQAELIEDSVQDMVDTIGSIDEQVQAVKEFAQKAETASSNAALSESRAKESKTAAETAKESAETAAESARQSATVVEAARQEVVENKTAVEQAVSGFDGKVVEANIAIENAKTEAVKAVEDKGNEVLQSIPPDFETQMANKVDKQQGIENKGKALVVGEDGNVTVGEVQGGDGIAIINTMSGASPLVIPDSAERVNKGLSIIGNTVQNQDPPPSPDNPQEIKNVGKWNPETQKYEVDVRTIGSNQFDVDAIKTIHLEGDFNGYELHLAPGRYTLSTENKIGNTGSGEYIYVKIKRIDGSFSASIYVIANEVKKTVNIKINKDEIVYFYDVLNKDESKQELSKSIFKKYDFMLTFGDAPMPYEPYKEQTITLTSDRPITKWDKLVEKDGQIGWLYQSGNAKLTNVRTQYPNEDIKGKTFSRFETTIHCGLDDFKRKEMLCTKLRNNSTDDDIFFNTLGGGYIVLYFNKNLAIDNIEKANAWILSNSDIEFLYYDLINTPTFVPLPQSEQEAIRALTTYYPTTVITADGGEVDPNIEVTYTADTKNYIDQKIEAINKAIVTTQKALL